MLESDTLLNITCLVIILMTTFGNLLVVLVVKCSSNIRSMTNIFTINLAVADLLVGLCVLPFSSFFPLINKQWKYDTMFCDIWTSVNIVSFTVSLITHCIICVDQYFAVARPLTYANFFTYSRARYASFIIWIISIAMSVSALLDWKGSRPAALDVCEVTKQFLYIIFLVTFIFYLLSFIIFILYFMIYKNAARQTKFFRPIIKIIKSTDLKALQEFMLRVYSTEANHILSATVPKETYEDITNIKTTAASLLGYQVKFQKQKKVAKIFSIVFGAFFWCRFPFFIILPLRTLYPQYYSVNVLFDVFRLIGYASSCLNPVIYGYFSREFRQAYHYVFQCGRSETFNDLQSFCFRTKNLYLKNTRRIIFGKNTINECSTDPNRMRADANKSSPLIQCKKSSDSESSCTIKGNENAFSNFTTGEISSVFPFYTGRSECVSLP